MSEKAEPGPPITIEADVEYSEVVELSTLSKGQQEEIVMRPPPEFAETQFGHYIAIEEDTMHRPSTSRSYFDYEQPSTSREGSTFHRYSTVENTGVIEYENVLHGRIPSPDVIVPRFRNTVGCDVTDDVLSLRTRLKYKRQRLPFLEYACYAIEEVFQEVEKILVLDIVFLIFSMGVTILGTTRVTACNFSPTIPVVTVVSGVVDAFINVLSICAIATKRASLKEGLLDVIRVGRFTLFFIHIYGLVKVYSILPPEDSDRTSPEYCESGLYWVAFSFFHITTLSSIVVLLGMAKAVSCFHQ